MTTTNRHREGTAEQRRWAATVTLARGPMTVTELAAGIQAHIGRSFHRTTLANIEAGRRNLTPEIASAISAVLGLDPILFGYEAEPAKAAA